MGQLWTRIHNLDFSNQALFRGLGIALAFGVLRLKD